jgi:hypothetical protein
MADRLCNDCDTFLPDDEGWLVPFDYPEMDPLIATLGKLVVCDRCLLTRRRRGTPKADRDRTG